MPRPVAKPREGYMTQSQRKRRGRKKESQRAHFANRLARRFDLP